MIRIDLRKSAPDKTENTGLGTALSWSERLRRFLPSGDLGGRDRWLWLAALAACLDMGVILWHQARLASLRAQSQAVALELDHLAPFQQELTNYEVQRQSIAQRLSLIDELMSHRASSVHVLDAMGQAVPEGLWLDNVELQWAQNSAQIRVSGHALSSELVSDFADQLSDSVYLGLAQIQEVTPDVGKKSAPMARHFVMTLSATDATAAPAPQGVQVSRSPANRVRGAGHPFSGNAGT